MKVSTQFGITLLVITLVLSGVVYTGFETQRDRAIAREQNQVNETAGIVAQQINYQLRQRKREISVAANDPSMREFGTTEQREALAEFHRDSEFFTVAIIAKNGTKIDIRGVNEEVRRKLIGTDYSQRPYVRHALDGEVYVTDPFRADSGHLIAVVSAPLYDEDGEIVGVIGGSIVLNDRAFFSTLERFNSSEQAIYVSADDTELYNTSEPYDRAITSEATVAETGWQVRVERDRAAIADETSGLFGTLLVKQAVVLIIVLSLAGFGLLVYHTNLKQARRLLGGFEALKRGEYDRQVELGETEEWRRIEDGFRDLRQTLAERERALQHERDRFATLFENVPDPALVYELHGDSPCIRQVNEAFEETFGRDATAVKEDPVSSVLRPPDDEEVDLTGSLQRGDRLQAEVRLQTGDDDRDFLVRSAPFEGGGAIICADITEQKKRQRELARQREQLDEFASIVSHELRNPLTVAQGYTGLIEGEYAEDIRSSLDRMEELIDQLLTLARKGQQVASPERVSLAAVAEEAWENVDTSAGTLTIDADATMQADPGRLLELLENLFCNAVEHGSTSSRPEADDAVEYDARRASDRDAHGDAIEHGGEAVEVTVGTTSDGFYVEDDGEGLPDIDTDQLFDYGFTTEEEGTGLGLVIVDTIAEAHGWELTATESDDGGARFEFTGVWADRTEAREA